MAYRFTALTLPGLGVLAMLAASVSVVVAAAAEPSFLVPAGRNAFPDWLAGPLVGVGERIDWNRFGTLLIAMFAGWVVALAGARQLPRGVVIGAIVAGHLVFLIAPPLLSADVFGYVATGRLGVVHDVDPYLIGTATVPEDPVQLFLRWEDVRTPYGPLFTLLTYAFVPLGIAGAMWAFKLLTFAASLVTVALVWRISERLGRDPRSAAVMVGLSPVLLLFEVGGAHNDALVMLLTVAGIGLLVSGRPMGGTAAAAVAAGLKVSAAVVVPFAVAGQPRRRAALLGAGAGLAVIALAAVTGFRGNATGFLDTMPAAGDYVAHHSVPSVLARTFGAQEAGFAGWLAGTLLAAAVFLWMLWRAWHGADWIVCAGWSTLALLVGSVWLLPWYATWLAPLAALGDSRRLRIATVLFVAYVCATRVTLITTWAS